MSAPKGIPNNPTLSDGITTLRRFSAADAESFAAIHRDPLNIRWTGSVATMDASQAAEFIDGHIAEGWKSGTNLRFAITEGLHDAAAVVGTLSLQNVFATEEGGSASVGIKMLPSGRGTGAAQRAMQLLCGYAFGNLSLKYLHWMCTAGNLGSSLLAERCGFTLAAQIPGFGHVDSELAIGLIYSQSATQWNSRELGLDVTPVVPVLRGEGVVLRSLTMKDAPVLLENCRDGEAIRWTTVPLNYTPGHAEYFIKTITKAGWRTAELLTFAVADATTDKLLGTVDLQCKNPGTATVGINMGAHARGTGASEQAVRLLLDYAFDQLNLSYVHWNALVPNWASRKLAWKLGFRFEGLSRGAYNDRGTPADLWQFSLADGEPRTPQQTWDGPVPLSR
ncbi:Protein N-acetyltransferase, RimJ/RimL family [Arthrobacter alpinus]|uniref:Protein N-acetyltransferase, RimJ/RimL family n=1 Tax=Arthrobacter alpinus TaxID=656366 RepID=A0A1H5JX47_9MICC|nr:GNAT family protein [Arthrobacter alpinus]SEE56827.1 Protein N-acetyltransferase, RimJ/RimL family [Arthrobacter alpinus]